MGASIAELHEREKRKGTAPAGQAGGYNDFEAIMSRLQNTSMPVEMRAALDRDFEYCRRVYFSEMDWILEELHLDRAAQEIGFQQQWDRSQVRIITFDGNDVGWLQTSAQDKELLVTQMFVDGPFQRRGIGTEVIQRLIAEATSLNLAVRLSVVKINPARRLYERLGFRMTHEDERKFYMKREPDVGRLAD